MSVTRRICSPRVTLVGAILSLGLLACPLSSLPASARLGGCRSDPIVFLSNNHKVSLSSAVSADLADVQEGDYTLHIPTGVKVDHSVYTNGRMRNVEKFTLFADNTSTAYDSDTYVVTHDSGNDVTATSMAVDQAHDSSTKASASGKDHQHLTVHLSI